jgi:putative PIN family toxin of toxin-antitoxin system
LRQQIRPRSTDDPAIFLRWVRRARQIPIRRKHTILTARSKRVDEEAGVRPLHVNYELLGILARKFSRDPEELAHVAVFLSDLAHYVKPRRRLQVVRDDPDNRILECALTGRADAQVTGDHALLALRKYRGVHIMSLRAYLDTQDT